MRSLRYHRHIYTYCPRLPVRPAVRASPSHERLTGMLRGEDILRVDDTGLFVPHLGPTAVPEPVLVERAIAAAARKTRYKRKV